MLVRLGTSWCRILTPGTCWTLKIALSVYTKRSASRGRGARAGAARQEPRLAEQELRVGRGGAGLPAATGGRGHLTSRGGGLRRGDGLGEGRRGGEGRAQPAAAAGSIPDDGQTSYLVEPLVVGLQPLGMQLLFEISKNFGCGRGRGSIRRAPLRLSGAAHSST